MTHSLLHHIILSAVLSLIHLISAQSSLNYPAEWKSVDWLIGKWKSEFDGKMVWPTVPTLTYGEVFELVPAPISNENGIPMLRYSAYSWSHSTKDHFLDSYGYMSLDRGGNATLITTMNTGFSTLESGPASFGLVNLGLREIGRMSIARQIPVEDMNRQFRLIDSNYIEQIISMRTSQHPHSGMLEHARVLYEKVKEPEPTTTTTTTTTTIEPIADLATTTVAQPVSTTVIASTTQPETTTVAQPNTVTQSKAPPKSDIFGDFVDDVVVEVPEDPVEQAASSS